MKHTASKILWVLLAVMFTACGATASPTPIPVTGRITFAGSTTIQPLISRMADAYKVLYPGVSLDIAGGGSQVGIQAIQAGSVDIGMASRELTPEESQGIHAFQIATDVIAMVVNPANPVANLTLADLASIYRGEQANWSAFGGPDLPIVPVTRETTSGTRTAFDELVLAKQDPIAPALETAVTAGDVVARVAVEAGAIGYVGFGNLDSTVKAVPVNGIPPTPASVGDKTYPLIRPLYLMTGPLTQPIAIQFIVYVLSPEGQKMVEEFGWVPVQKNQQ